MSNRTCWLILIVLTAVTANVARAVSVDPNPRVPETKTIIAVIPFQLVSTDGKAAPQSSGVARGLEDALLASLSENPHVAIVERAELEKAFREQNLAAATLTDPTTAAHAGNTLKADLIVLGRVRALATEFNVTVRVISCASGEVLAASEIQGEPAALIRQAGSMADDVAGAVPKLKSSEPSGDVKTAALEALKHHERATALKGANAFEEAAAEELLALNADASMKAADEGFLDALAKAGFPELAKAEAQSRMQADKSNAGNAALRELANLAEPSRVKAAPVLEALRIDAGRRLAEWFDQQGRNGNLEAQRDACLAWMNLGDHYAGEGRDALAIQAYAQGMSRVRLLRALDPRLLGDWSFGFSSLNLPPAERLLECIIRARYSRNDYLPDATEMALWNDVLQTPTPVPLEGAVASLPVYEFLIPVVDQVYLPASRGLSKGGGAGEFNYLFQIDWKQLPPGTIVIRAALRTQDGMTEGINELQLVQQRWVGSEATLTQARQGVPWIADMGSGLHTVTGRNTQAGKLMSLAEAISISMAQQNPARGFLVFNTTAKTESLSDAVKRKTAVQISAAFPPGKQPAGATIDSVWHVESGLLMFLKGDKVAAAKEWKMARDQTLSRDTADHEREKPFWKVLLAACEGAKP